MARAALQEVVSWLQEELFSPVIAVAATPAADSILAARNGLTLVDLLRPFNEVTGINGEPTLYPLTVIAPSPAYCMDAHGL